MLHQGDCLEVMAAMEAGSVDAIVTDPPYGLGFMGKRWDTPGAFVERKARLAAGSFDGIGGNHHPTSEADVARTRLSEGVKAQAWHEQWARAALRVAQPGAYLLAFGGTRTYHRMVVAIEDAGWIIRDTLCWVYASGFPKGRANLKPAWEPIVMARKPGPLRPLAIDECRIPFQPDDTPSERVDEATQESLYPGAFAAKPGRRVKSDRAAAAAAAAGYASSRARGTARQSVAIGKESRDGTNAYDPFAIAGRWPANVVLTDPAFDGGWDGVVGGGETPHTSGVASGPTWSGPSGSPSRSPFAGTDRDPQFYGDSGTYSRFFLIPKASRAEREPTFGDIQPRRETAHRRTGAMDTPYLRGETERRNAHPTVKPVELMRHLVRLVTPRGGTVLDPFLGSGTTAIAAEMEGFAWVGIEREAEYVAIAEARLQGVQRGMGLSA